ncbi:hypothetical protein, partial [Candidatus Chlorohelix sp.]|uniref:hypothetical protein n=1 Tax=Candidatus Chlorohelix sp. TaxID=3139201 RepID=UPI003020978B
LRQPNEGASECAPTNHYKRGYVPIIGLPIPLFLQGGKAYNSRCHNAMGSELIQGVSTACRSKRVVFPILLLGICWFNMCSQLNLLAGFYNITVVIFMRHVKI